MASGELSVGERCGHHQVQIWRDWPGQAGACTDEETLRGAVISDDWRDERPDMERDGKAAKITSKAAAALVAELSGLTFDAIETVDEKGAVSYATGGIGLVFPTSLCSGQAGNMIAKRLHTQFVDDWAAAPKPAAKPASGLTTTVTVTAPGGRVISKMSTGGEPPAAAKPFSKIVAIPHTEGCGSSGGDSEQVRASSRPADGEGLG
eukprot:SAG22_NODE_1301_length_4800_cov_6.150394_5_plen_206_part_00